MPANGDNEVIVEMRPIGGVVRVAAIDVATGTEVVVMGPASASPQSLEQLAIAKLKRRLAMDRGS
jgi:ABC-type Zn2+ transport system substrate-binding protein/surface adhesin